MLNPKNTEDFYIKNSLSNAQDGLGFDLNDFHSPSEELDGIEVLVQMAKQGKIDPWNIDIADIADKYMLHLAEVKSDNLRLSSRAWLFLAILLKLKSNILLGIDALTVLPEETGEFTVDELLDEPLEDDIPDYYGDKVIPIEDIIQRRTSVKLNRKRIVTLKDLIKQLQFYEHLDKKQAIQNTLERAKRRVTNFKNLSSAEIINLAQEDYIEPGVKVLQENLIQIFEKEEKVELETLTLLGLDRTTAYISLLFLTAKSDCSYNLEQKEFYSDLYVTNGLENQIDRLTEVKTAV